MKSVQTGNQKLIKQINKSIVFNIIRKEAPISRSEISEKTQLNKATVSTMVSELIDESFVSETEGKSSGGRKPMMLDFNNQAGYSIGLDLGVNYINGILTDLSGNIVKHSRIDLFSQNEKTIITEIDLLIQKFIENAPNSSYGIIGIGIGFPGQIDQNEQILVTPNLDWKNKDLKKHLENTFNIPATIENEANAGSYGEHLYGTAQNYSNIIYLSIGIGIGAGIMVDSELYRGRNGTAGEVGHFSIDFNGKKCSCGNRGCWELYASESSLLKNAEKEGILKNNTIHQSDLEYIYQEAKNENSDVLQLLERIAIKIGIGMVNIINTFNPEIVIIGNRMALFAPWISDSIQKTIEDRVFVSNKTNINFSFSNLDGMSTALGANSFAIENFLDRKNLNRNI